MINRQYFAVSAVCYLASIIYIVSDLYVAAGVLFVLATLVLIRAIKDKN